MQKLSDIICEIPVQKISFFPYGKYKGQSVKLCKDDYYISWFAKTTNNEIAKSLLKEKGFVEVNGEYLSPTEYQNYLKTLELSKDIKKNIGKVCELDIVRNFDNEGKFVDKLNKIVYLFPRGRFRIEYFREYVYSTPLIGKTAKRIKGKKIQFIGKINENPQIANVHALYTYIDVVFITKIGDKPTKPESPQEKLAILLTI